MSDIQREEINEKISVQYLQFLLLIARDPIHRARNRNNDHEDSIGNMPKCEQSESNSCTIEDHEKNDILSVTQGGLVEFMQVWRSGLDESGIISRGEISFESDTFARGQCDRDVEMSKIVLKKDEMNDQNAENLENGVASASLLTNYELSLNSFNTLCAMKYGVDSIFDCRLIKCGVVKCITEAEICRALLAAFQGLAGEYFYRTDGMYVCNLQGLGQQRHIWTFAYEGQCSLTTLSTAALDSIICRMLRDLADTSTVIREFCCVDEHKYRSQVLQGLQMGIRQLVLRPFESDIHQFERRLYLAGKNGELNNARSEYVVGTLISLQRCISGKWKRILLCCQKLIRQACCALGFPDLIDLSESQTNAKSSALCLNILFRLMQSNEFCHEMGVWSGGRKLACSLFLEAFCPYLQILEKWMFFGILDDRWNESFLYINNNGYCNPDSLKELVQYSHENVLIRNEHSQIPCIIDAKLSDSIRWCGLQKNLLLKLSPQSETKYESIVAKFKTAFTGSGLAENSFKFEKELGSVIQRYCNSVGRECAARFLDEKLIGLSIVEYSNVSSFAKGSSLVEYMQMIRCLFCFADTEIWRPFESALFSYIENYFDVWKCPSAFQESASNLLFQSATRLSQLLQQGIESRYENDLIFLPNRLHRQGGPYEARAISLLRSVEISLTTDVKEQGTGGAKPLCVLGSIELSVARSCWLTDSMVLKLNAIFSLLLKVRYCNRSLYSLRWNAQKVDRQGSLAYPRKCFVTISNMIHVTRCLLNHILHSTAINRIPVTKLRECVDLKQMLHFHAVDIDQIFDACMLSPRFGSLNGYMNKLLICTVSYINLCSFKFQLSFEQEKTLETTALTYSAHFKFFMALLDEHVRSTNCSEARPLGHLFTELSFNQ